MTPGEGGNFMDAATMDKAADWLAAARIEGKTVSDIPVALKPATEAEGYDIQDRVRQRLIAKGRGRLIGWKVGATTAPMQKLLNLPGPAAGGILASADLKTPAKLRFADYRKPGIECEVCVRLKSPLGGNEKVDRATAAAVGSIHPAIEVVDNRYGDFARIGAPTIIADDVFHAAIILGPEIKQWQGLDLAGNEGTATVDGEVKLRGKGADVLGHPFESVAWLANLLAGRGQRLEAGQLVMTGSITLPYWASQGETVEIRIAGLGAATATLV
jgi:2-oxo-3-hexenedioate decarboxylase/2-keto-4-pentenoate hydratase